MKRILLYAFGLMATIGQSCDRYEVGEYEPLPKLHIGEPFKYCCVPENYKQLEYDSTASVAFLNFYKDEVTDLDYIDYNEEACSFVFRKGETSRYRISWDYETDRNAIRLVYGQNGMWFKMNNKNNEYILTANDSMTVCVVSYRSEYDSLNVCFNHFRIEEYDGQ